jgi:hypothetical protein
MQIDAVSYMPLPPSFDSGMRREEGAGEAKPVVASSEGEEAQLDMDRENASKNPAQQVQSTSGDTYAKTGLLDFFA